jgi:Transposase DDE domain
VAEAAALLATVTGQDIEETNDGRFAIFEGTAPDRVISTVDPEARHGHKTAAHGFDGYNIDPDSEVICAAEVCAATSGDAAVAPTLLGNLTSGEGDQAAPPVVYGDSAYGTGVHLAWLEQPGVHADDQDAGPDRTRRPVRQGSVPHRPQGPDGDLPGPGDGGHPPGPPGWGPRSVRRRVQRLSAASGLHRSVRGRVVAVHPREAELAAARARQRDPAWLADYRATRPKVERKLAHLLRRRHGGRHARVRGLVRVAQDFKLLAAAVNLARLATLGLRSTSTGWQLQPA